MPSLLPPTPLPAVSLAVLAEIADLRFADALLDDGGGVGPCLLRVRVDDDEVELGWLPLAPGRHPVDELAGAVAPADWCAVGVACTGVARHLDHPAAPPVRVRSVHLVGRDGTWASRWSPLEPAGDGPGAAGGASSGGAGEPARPIGRVDDTCRRVLGLPTPPAPSSTALLWALQWLDAVVDAAGTTGGRHRLRRWPAVARLHPAVPALTSSAGDASPTPQQLAHEAHRLATWRDWPVLRRACAAGTWADPASGPELDPDLAAWLDDGAFARWVLGAYPDLDDLRAAVAGLLDPSVLAAVETTLAAVAAR